MMLNKEWLHQWELITAYQERAYSRFPTGFNVTNTILLTEITFFSILKSEENKNCNVRMIILIESCM